MNEKENPDHIDLNDARVYLIKFMETVNYAGMRKLFNDLTDEVHFELWMWVHKHESELITKTIEAFRFEEWYEDADKLEVIQQQIKIINHGTDKKKA